MSALDEAPLHQGVVGHVVWDTAGREHLLEHEDCRVYQIGLNIGLDHASVNKDARFNAFKLHFIQNAKSFVNFTHLLIYLG